MKRTLWTLFALGAVLLLAVSFWDRVPRTFDQAEPLSDDKPLVAAELSAVTTRSFNASGRLAYDFTAEKLTYYQVNPERESDADYTAVTQPFFVFYQPQHADWFLQSKRGTASNLDDSLTLEEDVLAWQEGDDGELANITTSLLTIHPQPQIAETDKPVIIRFPEARYTAEGGLTADLQAESFVLHDHIEGIHEAPAP